MFNTNLDNQCGAGETESDESDAKMICLYLCYCLRKKETLGGK